MKDNLKDSKIKCDYRDKALSNEEMKKTKGGWWYYYCCARPPIWI